MTHHKGKIGSLPAHIRAEVCQRMHDGETSTQILPWLNSLPEVLEVLDERWNEQPITPQNLSEWRQGGFQQWKRQHEHGNHLKVLTEWAVKISDAVPVEKLTGAAQRIMAGNLLDMIESMESTDALALLDALGGVTLSVDRSRQTDIAEAKLRVAEKQLAQRDEQLAHEREKLQIATVERFLKFQKSPEAQEILASRKPQYVQARLLRELMFGPLKDDPQPEETKEG